MFSVISSSVNNLTHNSAKRKELQFHLEAWFDYICFLSFSFICNTISILRHKFSFRSLNKCFLDTYYVLGLAYVNAHNRQKITFL